MMRMTWMRCFAWFYSRVDDVLNISGHRIGSAEVEHALVEHSSVVEAAVVGRPHEIKGEALFAFVICAQHVFSSTELIRQLRATVVLHIGEFAVPDSILFVPELPKTRSGKIMRRLLRQIALGVKEGLGDVTTLTDPSIVGTLQDLVAAMETQVRFPPCFLFQIMLRLH